MTLVKQRDIYDLLIKGVERSARTSSPTLVSLSKRISFADPLSFFALQRDHRFYWEDADGRASICGIGETYRLVAEGRNRFAEIETKRRELFQHAVIDADADATATGPLFAGGFAFDPDRPKTPLWQHFPDAELVMPTFMVTRAEHTWLTINVLVDQHTDPSQTADKLSEERDRLVQQASVATIAGQPLPAFTVTEIAADEWKRAVAEAASSIREGVIDKIVLSREIRLSADRPFTAGEVLRQLREQQRNSHLFAYVKKENCFIGASPERLVQKRGSEIRSACIAGTAPRGKTKHEDEAIGEQLLRDKKNLHEHKLVVNMIGEAMKGVCTQVQLPECPTLYKVKNVQHLYTPVAGKALPDTSVVPFVGELHPTPALGGWPQRQAVEKIREMEPYERGWYGSPIGWVDYKGDGEFAVAIRSGLLQGNDASLFAGNGIVGDSEPESEYRETQLKFRPMLSALGGEC